MKRGYTLRKINWVIPGGRSKRMFLMLGCVSWILMLLCSCGRNLPDSEQVIKRYLKEKYNQAGNTVRKQKSSYPTIIRKPGKALITSSLPKYKDVCLNGSKVKCIMPYKS